LRRAAEGGEFSSAALALGRARMRRAPAWPTRVRWNRRLLLGLATVGGAGPPGCPRRTPRRRRRPHERAAAGPPSRPGRAWGEREREGEGEREREEWGGGRGRERESEREGASEGGGREGEGERDCQPLCAIKHGALPVAA
jgi:hypothetical protein